MSDVERRIKGANQPFLNLPPPPLTFVNLHTMQALGVRRDLRVISQVLPYATTNSVRVSDIYGIGNTVDYADVDVYSWEVIEWLG